MELFILYIASVLSALGFAWLGWVVARLWCGRRTTTRWVYGYPFLKESRPNTRRVLG